MPPPPLRRADLDALADLQFFRPDAIGSWLSAKARLGLIAVSLLPACLYGPAIEEELALRSVSCGPTEPCLEGFACESGRCQSVDAAGGEVDAGAEDADVVDSGPDTGPNSRTPAPLPMVVDDYFLDRSGFGPISPFGTHQEDEACPMRAIADAAGDCHRILWEEPRELYTGAFWTIGWNYSNLVAQRVEAGATEVSFYAWGATGGERLEVGAGIRPGLNGNPYDEAEDRAYIVLTPKPTRYAVAIRSLATRPAVFGAFIFSLRGPDFPGGAEVYLDAIQWRKNLLPRALPYVVDDDFRGRVGFSAGGGADGRALHREDNTCPQRVAGFRGDCHRFIWGEGMGDSTGAFWIVGDGLEASEALTVPPGATQLHFYAWGRRGGEEMVFGAGIPDSAFDQAQDRRSLSLTTQPTAYSIRLDNLEGRAEVFGGFFWSAFASSNPEGLEVYVDTVEWR